MDGPPTEVYYKIQLYQDKLVVTCLQTIDEYDYNQEDFFKNDAGECLCWSDEEAAIRYLNDNFQAAFIDSEYIRGTPNKFKGMLK